MIISELRRYAPAMPKVFPALPADVPPALRFMLSVEAREEGWQFYKDMDALPWTGPDLPGWAENHVVGKLADRWPHVARADAAICGLLSEALRAVALNGRAFPRWWLSVAVVLANGHPERLRSCCERVIAHAGAAFAVPDGYDEESADSYLMKASGNFLDRDLTDDEAPRKAPAVKSLRPARDATAPDPFAAGAKVLESCDDMPF